jgi:hypothetical protein
MSAQDAAPRSFDRFCLSVGGILPAAITVWWAPDVAPASRDASTIGALGFAFSGVGHLLDPLRGAVAKMLPIGTQSYRLAVVNALAVFAFGMLFGMAMQRALRKFDARASRLSSAVAMFATLTVTISPAWQSEAASVGGVLLAAVLALTPSLLDPERSPGAILLSLTLALLADPATGLSGVALVLASPTHRAAVSRSRMLLGALGATLVFVLLTVLGGMAHTRVASDGVVTLTVGRAYVAKLAALTDTEWGTGSLAVAGSGLLIGYLQGATALVRSAFVLVVSALVLLGLGSGTASLLLSCAVAIGFASLAHVVLLRVRHSTIAFARASSGLIFIMLLAWPIALADMTSLRLAHRQDPAQAQWDLLALGGLPATALLVTDHTTFTRRLTALRVARGIAVDTELLDPSSMKAPGSRLAALNLPGLALWRDLYFQPHIGAFSLAHDAAAHALYVTRSKRLERPVTRYLLPDGVLFRVETEPRAQSDRRRALELSRPMRQMLIVATQNAKDAALTDLTASLLRAQAVALASGGDRDLVPALVEDLLRVRADHDFVDQLKRRLDSAAVDELE